MALQSFTLSIGALADADNNGKNYVPNQRIYIKKTNGVLQSIYRDLAGTSEIQQDGLANVTDNKGQFTFFIEAGDYNAEYQNQVTPITVVGADYFNNRVDESVQEIMERTPYVIGNFADGFTYDAYGQVGVDASGNVWAYVGAGSPNKVVTAGTVPSAPDYKQVFYNSAELVSYTENGDVDSALRKRSGYYTLAEAQAVNLEIGQCVTLTDYVNAIYKVVADSDTGGFYLTYKAGFKFRYLVDAFVLVEHFGAGQVGFQSAINYCQSAGVKELYVSKPLSVTAVSDFAGLSDLTINLCGNTLTINNSEASDPYIASGIRMTGGQGTANLTIQNGIVDGDNSFSVLVSSTILYRELGWNAAGGGYASRAVNDQNYTVNRGKCTIQDIHMKNSLGMVHFLTNTPCETINVTTKNVTNTTNVGVFTARNTEDVHYDNILVDGFNGKAFNVNYVRKPIYGTLRTKNKLQQLTPEDDLSFYIGHFCGDVVAGNLIELGQDDKTLKGNGLKVSYWAKSFTCSQLVLSSKLSGAFLQGVRKAKLGQITGECEQKATYTFNHTVYGEIFNGDVDFGDVNVKTLEINATTFAHFYDSVKDDPVDTSIKGTLKHNIVTSGKVYYNETKATQGACVQVESGSDGTGGDGSGNGKAIFVDRMPDYFTLDYEVRCPNLTGGNAVYFSGRGRNVELDLTARGLSSSGYVAHSVASGFNEVNFTYAGLISNWDTDAPQEVLFGTNTITSARITPSYCKQVGTGRPNGAGKGIHEFYDQNITKKIFNDYDNSTGWVDANGVSV